MLNLKGELVYLRALESDDLDFLYHLENDTSLWEISGTTTPYSKGVLQLYLDNSHRDIYEVKQLRLAICLKNNRLIGLIDLFDFDPKNQRAGVGVVVRNSEDRNRGAGTEALQLLVDYAFSILNLRQLYANVSESNTASIKLFSKMGFIKVGVKKDWIFDNGSYKNEILFQKINN